MNFLNNSQDRKYLQISIILTSLLLIARDIIGVNINQYVIFLFMSLCFIVLPKREVHSYLAYTCGIIFGVNAYILIVGIGAILLKDFENVSKNLSFITFFIILIFWEIFNCFFHYTSPQFSSILLYSANLLIFFYYFFSDKTNSYNKETIFFYGLGLGITLFILSVGVLQNPLDLVFDSTSDVRGAMGFSEDQSETHFYANANNLAYLSIVLLSLVLSLRKQIFSSSVIFYPLLVLSLLGGILSSSRTWTILCALVFIVLFLYINFKSKVKAIAISVLILAVLFYLFPNFLYVAFDGIQERFELGNLETAGNRTELLEEYSDFMSEHSEYALLGTGAIYYKNIAQCSNSCHNAFQQIYVSYGILGCIFFIISFFASFQKRENSCQFINYIPFISAIIFIQSIQFLNPFYLMIPIALTSVAYKIRLS